MSGPALLLLYSISIDQWLFGVSTAQQHASAVQREQRSHSCYGLGLKRFLVLGRTYLSLGEMRGPSGMYHGTHKSCPETPQAHLGPVLRAAYRISRVLNFCSYLCSRSLPRATLTRGRQNTVFIVETLFPRDRARDDLFVVRSFPASKS